MKKTGVLRASTIVAAAIATFESAAHAQSGASSIPNFIDQRPVPQTDQGRADEIEARRKADEELRRLTIESNAKRRAEEEARRALDADAKRHADEAARQLAVEEEAKRQADEAARKAAAEMEARRKAEDDARRAAADAEAQRIAAEERRRADEAAKQSAAEAEARRKAEEDAKRAAADAENNRAAAAAQAQRQAEEAARKKSEDDAKRATAEAEAQRVAADARRKAAEDAAAAAATVGRMATPALDIARLVSRGRQMIADGDLASARLILERAATTGDADAAMALADTFDPQVISRLGATGVSADTARAEYWREQARARGSIKPRSAPPVASTPDPAATTPLSPTPSPRPAGGADQLDTATRFATRGHSVLIGGDVSVARGLLERAADLGSAAAAFDLASSYDK